MTSGAGTGGVASVVVAQDEAEGAVERKVSRRAFQDVGADVDRRCRQASLCQTPDGVLSQYPLAALTAIAWP